MALIGRQESLEVCTEIPDFPDEQKRVIAATFGQTRVINLYVVNGKEVGSDKYEYKLAWLDASCPSCGARRMVDGAAWLVDQVLPQRPIRQRRRERPHVLREAQAVRE